MELVRALEDYETLVRRRPDIVLMTLGQDIGQGSIDVGHQIAQICVVGGVPFLDNHRVLADDAGIGDVEDPQVEPHVIGQTAAGR